jgi:hypothetical protein
MSDETLALPAALVATSITSLSSLISTLIFAPATDTAVTFAAVFDLCGPRVLQLWRQSLKDSFPLLPQQPTSTHQTGLFR